MAEHQHADALKCSICSKSLNVPKRLPCLHDFCKSCICQHIKTAIASEMDDERCSNFPCPVCKTVIPIPDQVVPSVYANDFPTNHLIYALIQRERFKNKEVYCGWCLQDEKRQLADIWCDGCNDGLCEDCFKVHKKINALKLHKVLHVEDVGKITEKLHFDVQCQVHKGKIIENFCHDHQVTCCSSCMTDYHWKCDKVSTIDTASKNQEQSTSELMQIIDDVIDVANDFLGSRNRNLKDIERERDEGLEKIILLKNKIVTYLDKLEQDFRQRFDKNHANIKKEIEDEIENCSNHKTIAINCKQLLSLSVGHSSDENVFTEKQIIEKKIKEVAEMVEQIKKEPIMRRYKIELTPEFVTLTESVTSIGTFSNIIGTPVQFTVQPLRKFPSTGNTNTQPIPAQEIFSFNPENFPSGKIHGAKILKDERILLTNADNRFLLIFDSTGKVQQEITVPGEPVDVTLISDNEAAVSYRPPNGIAVIDITTGIIKQNNIMKSGIKVCGITSDGVKLVAISDDEILVMDTSGYKVSHIKTHNTSKKRYINFVANNRVCYSNENINSIYCIDLDGSEIFTYQHEDLIYPYGITCDNEGLIYVVGNHSDNVHQISPTGELIKIILTEENGIKYPSAIHYNCSTKQLLLTHSDNTVTVYKK